MTLQRVEVRTSSGALLQLPFQDISDGYVIQDIAGLDPVKATLVSSSFAQIDGAQFQSSRREARNLVFQIGLEPDFVDNSVDDLRKRLVSFFKTESRVSLRFVTAGGLSVDIDGRVESFDAPRFTQEVVASISVICFDPDFYDATPVVIEDTSRSDLSSPTTYFNYNGTVDAGMVFTFNINRSISEFTLYHFGDNKLINMPFSLALLAGDVVKISTVPGDKYATLRRGGVTTSVLYAVSPYANWISLVPGSNVFRAYVTGAAIPFTIEYTTKYGEI